MITLELAKATASLASYAKDIDKDPVILTVDGRPVAALVGISNVDMESVTLSTHPEFLALIERSRARQKIVGGISTEEIQRRLGL